MKKVIDDAGNIIQGLYRAPDGSLVVNDQKTYNKYLAQREAALKKQSEIDELRNDIAELKALIHTLVTEKKQP